MTTFQRWGRGLLVASAAVLATALIDYFFPPLPVSRFWYYFGIGWAVLLGWLGGCGAERDANRIRVTREVA